VVELPFSRLYTHLPRHSNNCFAFTTCFAQLASYPFFVQVHRGSVQSGGMKFEEMWLRSQFPEDCKRRWSLLKQCCHWLLAGLMGRWEVWRTRFTMDQGYPGCETGSCFAAQSHAGHIQGPRVTVLGDLVVARTDLACRESQWPLNWQPSRPSLNGRAES
jgi:hypothetical protein